MNKVMNEVIEVGRISSVGYEMVIECEVHQDGTLDHHVRAASFGPRGAKASGTIECSLDDWRFDGSANCLKHDLSFLEAIAWAANQAERDSNTEMELTTEFVLAVRPRCGSTTKTEWCQQAAEHDGPHGPLH